MISDPFKPNLLEVKDWYKFGYSCSDPSCNGMTGNPEIFECSICGKPVKIDGKTK